VPYVSSLIGKPVSDVTGQLIGRLGDLVATVRSQMTHPEIVALCVKVSRRKTLLVPYADVAVLIAPAIPLTKHIEDVVPYEPAEHDLFLIRDVVDKQLIDTNGVRVVRVNDLQLVCVSQHFYVANVDIGSLGLLRRLGIADSVQNVGKKIGRDIPSSIISWEDVELLSGDRRIRLKVPSDKISDLHPADLAEIISDLSRVEGSKLLESLDVKTVADALEEVEPDFQASLVETMADEKVADVLGEMAPDEAADLLAELPEERSQELLSLMEVEDAQDVRKLLAYPEDTAGGIMTTEFIAIRPDFTAEEAISVLRQTAHEAETVFYIYVTDAENHLLGVFSLKDLLFAPPDTPILELTQKRVVSVECNDSQEDVAQIVAKYNLLAVPVVDTENKLQGIVTADDALDKIIPTTWKRRLPRLYA
jgi:magnesium transporter